MDRPVIEIRIDGLVNNAGLLKAAQSTLASTPIESIVIRFNHRHAFDFGAWCFAKRFGSSATKTVGISTHLPKRLAALKNMASHVITKSLTDNTPATGYSMMADWVIMAKWSEENEHQNFLDTPEEYHEAVKAFSAYLNNDHRQYSTRRRMRSICVKLGEEGFVDSEHIFTAQLPPIKRPNNTTTALQPVPSEKKLKHYLQVCEPLFVGLTNFLITRCKFPYQLHFKDYFAWIVADRRYPLISQKVLAKNGELTANSTTFDYGEARMRTWQEYLKRTESTESVAQRSYYVAKEAYSARMAEANGSDDNQYRIRVGRIAHDSFVSMFVAATGINESPLRALPWDAEFKIESDEIGFKAIKFRANNKTIIIKVKSSFIKHFKKYIKLRNFLCKDIEHPYLFIGFNGNTISKTRMLDTNILSRLHNSLQRFADPNLPLLSYRAFRDYKDNFIAKTHGHEASRNILQHSEKTQLKSYLKANEQTAVDQINKFHSAVNAFFGVPHPCATPLGGCESEGTPEVISEGLVTATPDCKNNVGCLNCVNYKAHANREDAWKLISLEYITKQMIQSSADIQHFHTTHGPTLQRIDSLLSGMATLDPDIINTITELRKEVYEDNSLTDYWQRHLERLVKLKVIA
ncbi:hypothetical protein [Pseudomonas sp. B7]|uniref:hypothetical protein n=1 Tax=Pseudomonas sp. B7 TaxID=360962 RepID=UPI00191CBFDA|nr:hypothetical protein [Pseudomonas sp. B7]MBL0797817.1 hypothetical protein [Pseudomonas sp. B7]